MRKTCAVAKVAGKKLACDEVQCSGWDHDKQQCMVNTFFSTYALLQVLTMQIKQKMDELEREEEEEGDDD